MKISKLYSNKPSLFEPIKFNDGLNVVIAEIRLPENKTKDTHNLGKTTLGRLIDFCLLSSSNKEDCFLLKHEDIFNDFVFFIELSLFDGSFLTVRRSVNKPTKISFKKHTQEDQDFCYLLDPQWDHLDIAFEQAKQLLDSILGLTTLTPWHYRKILGYLLRAQDDYLDVFQLHKFKGKDRDWKPFLAHILGFNGTQVKDCYTKEKELKDNQDKEAILKSELGGSIEDLSKIEELRLLKQDECNKIQKELDSLDFYGQDKEETKRIVHEYDEIIAMLNQERYSLSYNLKKVTDSLNDEQINFNPDDAQAIFKEAGVFFDGQLKKNFEQLIAFNKDITIERVKYLKEEKNEGS